MLNCLLSLVFIRSMLHVCLLAFKHYVGPCKALSYCVSELLLDNIKSCIVVELIKPGVFTALRCID